MEYLPCYVNVFPQQVTPFKIDIQLNDTLTARFGTRAQIENQVARRALKRIEIESTLASFFTKAFTWIAVGSLLFFTSSFFTVNTLALSTLKILSATIAVIGILGSGYHVQRYLELEENDFIGLDSLSVMLKLQANFAKISRETLEEDHNLGLQLQ